MAGAYGTQSAVLFEYLHRNPGRVEAAYLDSPTFTSATGFHGGAAALQDALDAFFQACEETPACVTTTPPSRGCGPKPWTAARPPPARERHRRWSERHRGRRRPQARTRREVALGGEGGPLPALPRIIHEAANGRLAPELAQMVADDPIFCSGYRPLCHDARFSLGHFLTNTVQHRALKRPGGNRGGPR